MNTAPVLRTVQIPAKLRAITAHPEFSGITWSPFHERYIVIVDDTGFEDKGTKHMPFLLGFYEDGRLDPEPIPIQGTKKINDGESLTRGPGESFFLITSHSLNRKNETPKSRRQLLHLEKQKKGLVVVGKVDLLQDLGSRSLLAIAGLPKDGCLDIEAITYHQGDLLIGLKSPLTRDGHATILRLADPVKVLQSGELPASAISLFAQISLCVDVKKSSVCQGISDLDVLPDGDLIAAANAPKKGPEDHGGSLWRIPMPIAQSQPQLLHRFLGLKPEGVALSPNQRELMIVFDTGQEPPRWTRIPVPAKKARPMK